MTARLPSWSVPEACLRDAVPHRAMASRITDHIPWRFSSKGVLLDMSRHRPHTVVILFQRCAYAYVCMLSNGLNPVRIGTVWGRADCREEALACHGTLKT